MIDVIASWWRLVRPNCLNAVIVRMRARDVGLKPALWKNNFEEFYANGRYFTRIRYLSQLRPWRASVQEIFCKAANVVVMIVERRKELLVRGQVPFGEPLQMASK